MRQRVDAVFGRAHLGAGAAQHLTRHLPVDVDVVGQQQADAAQAAGRTCDDCSVILTVVKSPFDGFAQFAGCDWFADKAIEHAVKFGQVDPRINEGGAQNHPRLGLRSLCRCGSQAAGQIDAAAAGQVQIDQRQIEGRRGALPQQQGGIETAGSLGLDSQCLHPALQDRPGIQVVVHHQGVQTLKSACFG